MAEWWEYDRSQGYGATSEGRDSGYTDPYTGITHPHFNKGIDYKTPAGTPIRSHIAGTVVSVRDEGGWGLRVVVQDANGNKHGWGHLSGADVQMYQQVVPGTLLARSGNSGTATSGAHTSYDVQNASGIFMDPDREGYLSGGAGGGTGGSGMDERARLTQEKQQAYDDWQSAKKAQGITGDGRTMPEYRAYLTAEFALEDYESAYGNVSSSGVDPAQQAFENQIALGDFQLGEGKLAYDRWADKYDRAQTAANEQIEAAHTKNEQNAALRANAQASSERRLQPYAEGKTYVPPTYSAAFERWKKEMGVGEEPALRGTGGPAVPVPTTTGPGAPSTGSGGSGTTTKYGPPDTRWQGPLAPEEVLSQGGGNDFRDYPGSAGLGPFTLNQMDRFGGQLRDAGAQFGRDWLEEARGTTRRGWRRTKKVFGGIPGFADGVQNFAGGPAVVGEEGEEVVELPGVGRVKASGPTLMNLPKGANVIPREQVMAQQRIGQLAQGGNDPGQKLREAQMRREDPELQQKVIASLQRALGAQLGVKPGHTPVLEPGQTNLWAYKRQLTGIQAFPPPMEVK